MRDMDSVTVTREWMGRVRGFCNLFAGMCSECYTERGSVRCDGCPAPRARELMSYIDSELSSGNRRPGYTRRGLMYAEDRRPRFENDVIVSLRQAGRPLKAKEIIIHGCYRQLKFVVLKSMTRSGKIVMKKEDGHRIYSLP